MENNHGSYFKKSKQLAKGMISSGLVSRAFVQACLKIFCDDSNQKEYDSRVISFVRSCISMGIQVLAMRPCLLIFVVHFHSEARALVKR